MARGLGLWMLAHLLAGAHAQPVTESTTKNMNMLPLEITVNSTPVGSWVLLELYAPAEAVDEWRVTRRAKAQPFTH